MTKIRIGFGGCVLWWWASGRRLVSSMVVFLIILLMAIVFAQNSGNNKNNLKKNRIGSNTILLRQKLLRTEMNQLHENTITLRNNNHNNMNDNIVVVGSGSNSESVSSSSSSSGSSSRSSSSSNIIRSKSYPSRPASLNSLLKLDHSLSLWDDSTYICHTVPGLTRHQMELCLKTPDATAIAINGLTMASEECAFQMEKNRWNCSSLQGSINPYNTHLLQKGYRESAFGHAIAAAGVAYAVAKACSQGKLLTCGCGLQYDDQVNYFPSKDTDYNFDESSSNELMLKRGTSTSSWKWSGCSHNMDYGMKFAKMFLDAREKSQDLPSRINLHNNRVGRLAVAGNMEIRCKCHGLSGSCELRTCWRSAPDFRRVGAELKNKFRRAVLIDQSEFGNRPPNRVENNKLSRQKRRQRRDRRQSKNKHGVVNIDLWYYEKSPTYCDLNHDFNIPGTSGRRCNKTDTKDAGSCSTLCCGRGYNTIRQVYTTRCQCQFIWCCQVICQSCVVDEWITVCK